MHQFLSAIGFSKLNKDSLKELIDEIILRPDYQESAIDFEGNQFVELRYMVADNIGLVLRGMYDDNDQFILDYYYPTFYGKTLSSNAEIDIVKQSDKENYHVMCDELKFGVNLIFQLQNMGEYLRRGKKISKGKQNGILLAGLSTDAKIILPIYDNEMSRTKAKLNYDKRIELVEQARGGDEEAMENLTIDEIDLYQKISRRIMREDILSVVTSYFMPYGIESDKYDVLGEIIEIKEVVNHLTMEEMYVMTIESNDVPIEVCINKKDLYGMPAVGCRFKGSIWLQGTVDFL
ncbi:MAG: DUF3881 family protein [Pseudobutyrivibrio sp.]|nr:DUF3881 family protein [Pseudobutyrivibrio sp.]